MAGNQSPSAGTLREGQSKTYDVRSITRAVSILTAFQDSEELNLVQLNERLDLPKATLFRLTSTLEREGLLEKAPNGSYCLGYRLISLARAVLIRSLPRTARPFLQQLYRTLGHTVNLAVLESGEVLFIEVIESRHAFRMVPAVGSRESLHATAVGKAIGAALSKEVLSQMLREHPLRQYTPTTITRRSQLDKELARTRELGYAIDVGECNAGAHGVAAVILNSSGVVGAISVSATANQLPTEDFEIVGTAVSDAARRISSALGANVRYPGHGGIDDEGRSMHDRESG